MPQIEGASCVEWGDACDWRIYPQPMSVVMWVVLVIVALFVIAGLVLVAVILRETWSSRRQWADEDREAGEDTRRGIADKDWWAGR